MGHPVEPYDDGYNEGDECPACHNAIFHGRTPYRMKALFSGISACDGSPAIPPIPPIILFQYPNGGCFWIGDSGSPHFFLAAYWANGTGWSTLLLDWAGWHLFRGEVEAPCVTGFGNILKCEEHDDYEGGSGSIRWGLKVDEGY